MLGRKLVSCRQSSRVWVIYRVFPVTLVWCNLELTIKVRGEAVGTAEHLVGEVVLLVVSWGWVPNFGQRAQLQVRTESENVLQFSIPWCCCRPIEIKVDVRLREKGRVNFHSVHEFEWEFNFEALLLDYPCMWSITLWVCTDAAQFVNI